MKRSIHVIKKENFYIYYITTKVVPRFKNIWCSNHFGASGNLVPKPFLIQNLSSPNAILWRNWGGANAHLEHQIGLHGRKTDFSCDLIKNDLPKYAISCQHQGILQGLLVVFCTFVFIAVFFTWWCQWLSSLPDFNWTHWIDYFFQIVVCLYAVSVQ